MNLQSKMIILVFNTSDTDSLNYIFQNYQPCHMRARTCKDFGLSNLNQCPSLHILENSSKTLGQKHNQTNLRCLFYIKRMHVNSKIYILHQSSQIGQSKYNRLCEDSTDNNRNSTLKPSKLITKKITIFLIILSTNEP